MQLILAAVLITFNWGLFIWAVNAGRTIETALGYYITPIMVVLLGLFLFKEKLKRLQWAALALAFIGVLTLTILSGRPPWISLGLAVSWSIYGLIKKTIGMPALEALAVETMLATPIGLLVIFYPAMSVFFTGVSGPGYVAELPHITLWLLLLCGALTTTPLFLFTHAARMLPLSTLGFIQFLSPTMSFLIGFFVFRECFPWYNFLAFCFIWSAVIMYVISLYAAPKQKLKGA